jgi:hypothetical protein
MKKTPVTLAVLAVLCLTGCSAPAPKAVSRPAKPEAAQAALSLGAFDSTCTDKRGDGNGSADIRSIEIHSDGTLVFVTYLLPKTSQPTDWADISFLTSASSSDGKRGYQFGTIFDAGVESSNFVFDNATAKQKNITNGAIFADGQISVRYPVADLAGLGKNFTWYGVVSVDQKDVDFCGTPTKGIAVSD